jgi:hypothetical protein
MWRAKVVWRSCRHHVARANYFWGAAREKTPSSPTFSPSLSHQRVSHFEQLCIVTLLPRKVTMISTIRAD